MSDTRYCEECDKQVPPKRAILGLTTCVPCQEELEKSGDYQKHRMEIHQSISGWQCENVETTLIRSNG